MDLPEIVLTNRTSDAGQPAYWDAGAVHAALTAAGIDRTLRSVERDLEQSSLLPAARKSSDLQDAAGKAPRALVVASFDDQAKRKRQQTLVLQLHAAPEAGLVLCANDGRLGRRWVYLPDDSVAAVTAGLEVLCAGKKSLIWPCGEVIAQCRALVAEHDTHDLTLADGTAVRLGTFAYAQTAPQKPGALPRQPGSQQGLSHLDRLEAESMHIIREVMAQAENPVMLYSVGKDSAVMLHLARKAFYPSPPPFPLLHVDTRWKFQAMYEFRSYMAKESGMDLIVHINPDGVEKDMNPFDHGSAMHTDVMKTQGLKQALDAHGFDVAFGGARRDEEKSRAKERVFSFRTAAHRWDPKNQRPELWNLYNGAKAKGESIRVFPLSNWTELDIWQYIYREQIPLVPLYFAAERPVVERDGVLTMVDDDRMRLHEGEQIELRRVRFRTLGCYPLTGAVESDADDLPSIVLELLQSKTSERQGRAIDADAAASMEQKKQEGYF